jgi:hypothetical protein
MKRSPKPRDPSAHLRSMGALRQRTIRDKRKGVKSDRAASKAALRKQAYGY